MTSAAQHKESAQVVEISKHLGRKRTARMPQLVTDALALIKQKEAQALEAALATNDGAKAELLRAMSVAYDHSAKLLLAAFDALTRKPSI